MRIILYVLGKEFRQILRNKQILPVIFIIPVVQLLVLVNAATFEIKNVNTHIIDEDNSPESRELINSLSGSGYFSIVSSSIAWDEAEKQIASNKVKMILRIREGFAEKIIRKESPEVLIVINAEDGAAAGVIQSYAMKILTNFSAQIIPSFRAVKGTVSQNIAIEERYWYNPTLDYKHYMVPGILGILISIIGFFLSSINIVKEKEAGTIEQLNVSPIKKYQFIAGKLIPFWLIALFELGFGLLVASLVYSINIEGSLLTVFLSAGIYLIILLSGGLLISTVSETQLQAMFITFFFNMLLILLSGLFTPIDSMPQWAQILAFFDPFAHFVEILRRVMLKGAGLPDIQKQILILSVYAATMLLLAVARYRKVA